MYKVKDIKSKVKLLRDIYFFSLSKINLIDIKEYKYLLKNSTVERDWEKRNLKSS